jgi:hypothetical protein
MTDTSQSTIFPTEKKQLPTGLNVLTILTFIGCALGAISIPLSKWLLEFSLKMTNKPEVMEQMTDKQLTDIEKAKLTFEAFNNNFVPLVLVSLLGVGLCFYGALRMRKLKKEGFPIYVIGQIVPIIGGIIFLGFSQQFSNVWSYVIGLGLPLIFILLYASFLKHMGK